MEVVCLAEHRRGGVGGQGCGLFQLLCAEESCLGGKACGSVGVTWLVCLGTGWVEGSRDLNLGTPCCMVEFHCAPNSVNLTEVEPATRSSDPILYTGEH